jgi:FlaA1/EpsC-like NDP-sugar epimerase/lipopolysaccharide/colanic/teichoic acid biosynthesis glycosyltransferase
MFSAKRLIDILLSSIGLMILIPFLPIIGLFIKLDSNGPVFFPLQRVGKNMKNFKMYKFRTMIDTPIEVGESVSPQFDPRVTSFGRFLRRTKINELPQLINILKGEMTFVGPRPEAPDLAELYPEEAKRVFSVKPGLVGPATILGRNEEECYPPGVDAKKYYIEKILPHKVQLDLQYVEDPTLFQDIKWICMGVKETLIGMVSRRHIHDNRSQIYLLTADLFFIGASYLFWSLVGGEGLIGPLMTLSIVVLVRFCCNVYFGMYGSLIRYMSFHDILGVLKGTTCGSLALILIAAVFGLNSYDGFTPVADWASLMLLLSGLRFALRFYWEKKRGKAEVRAKHRVLIYGAGDPGYVASRALAMEKHSPYEVVGFIDDAPDKYGKALNGLKVLGNRYHIKALAQLYKVEEVVVAEPEADPDRLAEIMQICQEANLRYRMLSSIEDFDSLARRTLPMRQMEFSDILPLPKICADSAAVRESLTGKTVLVNGSGGALGLELCRQILRYGCRKLIVLDRYESYLTELVTTLFQDFSPELIVPVIGDPDRIDFLQEVFENQRPNVVFHASMRKYLPFFAVDVGDIGRTNYLRTFNLAKTTSKFDCEIFVMISSVTAISGRNPITDSLRVAELALEHFFSDSNTRLIIARICDVAENRGGVVSIIEDQIRKQGTVTLPCVDAQTWLVSKYTAAEFVLQTLVEAKKNSFHEKVFACEAGSPIPLIEITRKLAHLYGLRLWSDLAVKYSAPSDESVSMSPQEILSSPPTYSPYVKVATENAGLTGEKTKSVFKDFVLAISTTLDSQDWETRTRELIRLCGPDLFMDKS